MPPHDISLRIIVERNETGGVFSKRRGSDSDPKHKSFPFNPPSTISTSPSGIASDDSSSSLASSTSGASSSATTTSSSISPTSPTTTTSSISPTSFITTTSSSSTTTLLPSTTSTTTSESSLTGVPPSATISSPSASAVTPTASDNGLSHQKQTLSQQTHLPVGAIAGGAIGGVVLIALVLLTFILLHRHRRRHHTAPSAEFMPSGNLVLPRVVSPPLDSGRAESFSSMTQLNTGYASTGQANAPGNYNYPFTENLSRVTPL